MISVNNLVKTYGTYSLRISLEIPEGRITGLVGKNGAGKSTTIKAILGLIKPDEGQAAVFGKPADRMTVSDRERIGAAFSNSGFSGSLDVEDVLRILGKMYHKFDEERFRAGCRSQKLPLEKQIKDFSTGMKAKLRVLAALSHEAELLILDEPTAGLDVEARMQVLDMIREYMREDEGRSVLVTSHISSDLEGLCDDLYLLHDGEVLMHEETDNILAHYGILKVDDETYGRLDQTYILRAKKEQFGYTCFTDQRQYYQDNYPGIIIEKGNIDDLILMMTGGR